MKPVDARSWCSHTVARLRPDSEEHRVARCWTAGWSVPCASHSRSLSASSASAGSMTTRRSGLVHRCTRQLRPRHRWGAQSPRPSAPAKVPPSTLSRPLDRERERKERKQTVETKEENKRRKNIVYDGWVLFFMMKVGAIKYSLRPTKTVRLKKFRHTTSSGK